MCSSSVPSRFLLPFLCIRVIYFVIWSCLLNIVTILVLDIVLYIRRLRLVSSSSSAVQCLGLLLGHLRAKDCQGFIISLVASLYMAWALSSVAVFSFSINLRKDWRYALEACLIFSGFCRVVLGILRSVLVSSPALPSGTFS